jgi:hypothetical protein
VFLTLADRLAAMPDKALPWGGIWDILQRLRGAGVQMKDASLAMVAYRANQFGDAVKLWEALRDTERKDYMRAKAHVSPFPENIVWFGRIGEHGEVMRRWRDHHPTLRGFEKPDESVIRAVVDAALAERDLPLAAKLLGSSLDTERIAKLLVMAIDARDDDTTSAAAVLAARMFVRTRSWSAAIRAAEAADFSELVGDRMEELQSMLRSTNGATNVFRAVAEELAVSEHLPSETVQRKEPVAEFLNRNFLVGGVSPANLRGLSPQVVGAAIERAGKIVDALRFYETLERSASTNEVRRFAAERLCRNLLRYANYFRYVRKDEKEAQGKELDARKILKQYGLDERQIPDYPVVYSDTEPAEPAKWIRGPLRIVLSREHQRLRIEYPQRFETVTVDGKKGNLLGDASFSAAEVKAGEWAAWEIVDWKVRVSLVAQDLSKVVVIEMGSDRFEFPLA